MLKINHLFLANFFIIFLITFGTYTFFSYKTQKDTTEISQQQKITNISKILNHESLNLNQEFIDYISTQTKLNIGIFDKENSPIVLSDKSLKDIILKKELKTSEIFEFLTPNSKQMLGLYLQNKKYNILITSEKKQTKTDMSLFTNKGFNIASICFIVLFIIYKIFQTHIEKEIYKIIDFLSNISQSNYNVALKNTKSTDLKLLYDSLNLTKEKLQEKDKKNRKKSAKIRFRNMQLEAILSSISHEFKNPIAIIKASIQTIQNDPNMDIATKNKFTNKIEKNCIKLTNLIDRLKINLEDEEINIKKTDFDISKLAKEVTQSLQEKYQNRNIIINSDNNSIMNADKTMIEQVIANLVENALKYSKDDILIEIKNGKFMVIDKGIGIPQDEIKLVTKKFYRVNKNNWNNSFGLGLYIVKFMLKLHDISLIILSKEGVGSQIGFKFKLF
ncbi:MAG: ATP-binding protein [Campylobacter sputorum]|uniref:sensor histidine kinase n=1 Tax=Campylobacter sputorum TaxID=206 RepID=UPI000B775A81|nr:ATP-binding protein [Campylobacter sputorum]ASM38270.1 two-component system sensor histidine kinase [Campylobacter sputorum bv. paraureolyticus LMG 11764]MDY6120943.1 ATP-binding protein [Campylobacter sputorum]